MGCICSSPQLEKEIDWKMEKANETQPDDHILLSIIHNFVNQYCDVDTNAVTPVCDVAHAFYKYMLDEGYKTRMLDYDLEHCICYFLPLMSPTVTIGNLEPGPNGPEYINFLGLSRKAEPVKESGIIIKEQVIL